MDNKNHQIDHVEDSQRNDEGAKSRTVSGIVGLLILVGVIGLSVWRSLTMNKASRELVSPESIRRGHEQGDANTPAIVLSGVGLFISIVVIGFVLWGAFGYFSSHRIRPDMPPSPLADIQRVPPEPRLQVNPQEDLEQMRASENQILNSYGWVDEKAGIARIPIDRAMELIIKRGLPVRSAKGDEKKEN